MFHAQEKWLNRLTEPIETNNPNAWLGNGYYFWYYEDDAVFWGQTAKRNTGHFEVYKASIDFENVLDTVFNENHYLLWIEQIERAIMMYPNRRTDSWIS